VGNRNFEIDLVEFFASMTNGESFEGAHQNAPPGQELALLPNSRDCSYRFSSLFAQPFPEVSAKRIKIDVFDAAMKQVVMPSFGRSLGFTHMDPVGSLVAGSPEAVLFHESFQEVDRVMVEREPISRNPFGVKGENPRSQAWDKDPGEHKKAGVLGQKVQISYSGDGVPSNEGLSGFDSPGSGAPSQTSHRAFTDKSDVFEVAAHDLPVTEVMITSHEAVIEGLKGSVSSQPQVRCVKVSKVSPHGSLIDFHYWRAPVALVVVGAVESGRKLDQPLALKGEQELSTGHIAQPTVGLEPLPPLTQNLGDMGAPPLPV